MSVENVADLMGDEGDCFYCDVLSLGLSQIYISDSKLRKVYSWFRDRDFSNFEPVRVRDFGGSGKLTITDGHTRAYAVWKAGVRQIPVVIDNDKIFSEKTTLIEYNECIEWCDRFGLFDISSLNNRVLSDKDYQCLWDVRCDRMQDFVAGIVNGELAEDAVLEMRKKYTPQSIYLYGVSKDLKTFFYEDINAQKFIFSKGKLERA